jgi:hypothetical protein
MKTTRQARENSARTTTANQPQSGSNPPSRDPDLLVPSEIAQDMQECLDELAGEAGSMSALLLLSADWIHKESDAYDNWNDLCSRGFHTGAKKLADTLIGDFNAVFDEWREFLKPRIEVLRSHGQPVAVVKGAEYDERELHDDHVYWEGVDLAFWGEKLSLLLVNRSDDREGGVRIVIETATCLERALNDAEHAAHRFQRVFCAVRATAAVAA